MKVEKYSDELEAQREKKMPNHEYEFTEELYSNRIPMLWKNKSHNKIPGINDAN